MVREVSSVEYGDELEEKGNKLLDITKTIVDEWRRIEMTISVLYIRGKDEVESIPIIVDITGNSIHVDSKDYLDEARSLAEAYEEVYGKNSFILEIDDASRENNILLFKPKPK